MDAADHLLTPLPLGQVSTDVAVLQIYIYNFVALFQQYFSGLSADSTGTSSDYIDSHVKTPSQL